jgi:hypothetical protein
MQMCLAAGWLLGSYFLGGFGPEGQGLNGVPSAALAAIKSWAVGIPVRHIFIPPDLNFTLEH